MSIKPNHRMNGAAKNLRKRKSVGRREKVEDSVEEFLVVEWDEVRGRIGGGGPLKKSLIRP